MGMFTPTITATQLLSALQADSIQNVGSTTRPIFQFDARQDTALKIAGAMTLLQEADTNFYRGYVCRKSVGADANDIMGLGQVYIPVAGTYTAVGIWETSTSEAIASIFLNGTSKGTIDCYAGSTVNNVVLSGSLGTLTAGWYEVQLRTPTKNGSSTGYNIRFSSLAIYKSV